MTGLCQCLDNCVQQAAHSEGRGKGKGSAYRRLESVSRMSEVQLCASPP